MCTLSQYALVFALALIFIGLAVMPFCVRAEYRDEVNGLGILLTPYIWQSKWLTPVGALAQKGMLIGWAMGVFFVLINQFGWSGCIPG